MAGEADEEKNYMRSVQGLREGLRAMGEQGTCMQAIWGRNLGLQLLRVGRQSTDKSIDKVDRRSACISWGQGGCAGGGPSQTRDILRQRLEQRPPIQAACPALGDAQSIKYR